MFRANEIARRQRDLAHATVPKCNLATLDYSVLVSLAVQPGILQSQQAVVSFGKEGLFA